MEDWEDDETKVKGAASESDEDTGSASASASRLSSKDLFIRSSSAGWWGAGSEERGGMWETFVDARMGNVEGDKGRCWCW